MNETRKTFAFVGVAAAMSLLAIASHFMNRPTNSADFEMVSEPFFPEFTSASQATSLEVAAVDPETARLKRFSVENKDGLWRIPSHFDYPAEAAARLATTASSVMGIERESLAGRIAKEHERLGVLDPLSDEIDDPESVGKRISLKDADGEVVVDYIVGKEAGDVVLSETDRPFGNEGNEKYYFVRRPDEQQTYKVKLDIDLSTKFSDWIDPDLLRITIDNYTLEEDRSNPLAQTKALFKAQGDKLQISRASNTDGWELEGLNAEKEEIQTARINEMLGVFDQMKIVGVRPKYKYKNHLLLTADLQLNKQPEFEENPQEFGRAISRLQNELEQKGFSLAGSAKKMELVAQHGDLEIGTDKGVLYTLHIGRAVEGDEEEIEIGTGGSADQKESDPADPGADSETADDKTKDDESTQTGGSKGDEEGESDEAKPDADARNRYLMVRVSFDESLIVPKPIAPSEPASPKKPEGYQTPAEDSKEEDPASSPPDDVANPEGGDAGDEGEASDDDSSAEDSLDDKPQRNPEFVKYDEAIKAFGELRLLYEAAKTRFEDETKEFAEKVKEGQKLVDELNQRFGNWYYVISADNLEKLQSERTDLVKTKEPPAGANPVPPRPNISFPDLPGVEGGVKAPATTEEAEKPEDARGSTEEPAEPTEEPAEPTEKPAEPTEEPAEPTEEPAETPG